MFSAFTAVRERRKNRHGLFGVAVQKKKLWTAQVLVCTFYLLITCAVFFLMISVAGFLFGETISLTQGLTANIVLFVTYAWQIPLWMFLAEKTGAVLPVFVSLLCNQLAAIVAAVRNFWWIPFAVPARLMCVCVHILPNGLPMDAQNPLSDRSVMLLAILLAVVWYVGITLATAFWFEKREAA